MNTNKIILTGLLLFSGLLSFAQSDKKTEPVMPEATISNQQMAKKVIPGAAYQHPEHIMPRMDPAMEIAETTPVLPNPGKYEIPKTKEVVSPIPVYPTDSKSGIPSKPANESLRKKP